MPLKNILPVTMVVPTHIAFLPVATAFIEKAVFAFGFREQETTALTLATEELFAYLCRVAASEERTELTCSSAGYYVRVELLVPVKDFDMRLFNLTAAVSLDDDASVEEMGLLIASRLVDQLTVQWEGRERIRLVLTKEKSYPAVAESSAPPVPYMERFSVRSPRSEELKIFVASLNAHYPPWLFPTAFKFPGKVVDMIAAGAYKAAFAQGGAGPAAGGMFWHWMGTKTIECFGPYLFNQPKNRLMADALFETCLGDIAKSSAVALINRLPTEALAPEHFEALGSLTLYDPSGETRALPAYFRQLQEDPGTYSWSHPELASFLREQYARLVLPRELQLVQDQGETKNPCSVLSTEFDRLQHQVVVRPLRPGADSEKNLADHVALFTSENIRNIFFEMDLALSWHTEFTPGLLRSGFLPRLVLPYGGEGDLVIFQWGGAQ